MRIYFLLAAFIFLGPVPLKAPAQNLAAAAKPRGTAPTITVKTASGERFNQNALTAAHRTLAFGTRVKVTNTLNNKSVTVRINDRGPYSKGRVIDLSRAAASKIDMIQNGVVPVRLQVLR